MVSKNSIRNLESKYDVPGLPTYFLHRPELLDHLSESLDHSATLITAPAGYGKTTLASHWAQESGKHTCWLRLDEDDNQLTFFLNNLLAAIETQRLGACPTTHLVLDLPNLPPSTSLMANLINELADLPEPFVLVLDNFYLIQDQEVLHLVQALVENQLASLRLLILSRGIPQISIPRLRARKQLVEIGVEALAFNQDETQAYLDLVAGRKVKPETAAFLGEWSEGWITGLKQASLALREGLAKNDIGLQEISVIQETLIDYFSHEVLVGHPPDVKHFINQIAILKYLCPPLCDKLLGNESELDSHTLLSELHRRGSFLQPVTNRPGWYRFQLLFRQTLQQITDESHDTLASLHNRASEWLVENDYIEDAIIHALSADNQEAAASIVEEHVQIALAREDIAALGQWLELLPPDLISSRPALLIAKVWQQQLSNRNIDTEPLLKRAKELLQETETDADPKRLRTEIAALSSSHCYWRGNYKEALQFAQGALAQPTNSTFTTSHALAYLAMAQYTTGDRDKVFEILEHNIHRYGTSGTANLSPLLQANAQLCLTSTRLYQLADIGNSYLKYGLRLQLRLTSAWGHYFLGRVNYEWNNLDDAADHFSAVAYAEPPFALEARADSLLALALIYQTKGDMKASKEAIALLEATDNLFGVQIASLKARSALLNGDAKGAVSWIEATAVPQTLDTLLCNMSPLLIRIRVLIAQNTHDSLLEAINLLDITQKAARASHNRLVLVNVLALRALALRAQRQTEAAAEVLSHAVRMGGYGGMIRVFVDLGLPMADLLHNFVQIQENGDEYAERLIEAFSPGPSIVHPLVVAANEKLIEPLTERELEVLQILARRLTNKEIAQMLGISPLTVKKHTINIYQKLNVENRRAAAVAADQHGLILDP